MSEYQEFTGKNVEEALRKAREAFGVTGLDDLDFEILTPGSRGVLGMGAEPARILAASRALRSASSTFLPVNSWYSLIGVSLGGCCGRGLGWV